MMHCSMTVKTCVLIYSICDMSLEKRKSLYISELLAQSDLIQQSSSAVSSSNGRWRRWRWATGEGRRGWEI